jgi:hypothetical protein
MKISNFTSGRNMMRISTISARLALATLLTAALAFSASTSSLTPGKAELKSAGALAFGPDGVLFVGDSASASIFALDTADAVKCTPPQCKAVEVKGVNEKIAALLGTAPDQIIINDMAVNPISKNVYMSISRGRGPDAIPVILRVDASGKISELRLDNIRHSMVRLPNAPESKEGRANPRLDTITDMAFVNGNVIVAGLSNEEFSSNLRSIPFPFQTAGNGASIEIYHGSHGRFETNAPVRTFVPYTIKNEQYILAAYTCTPLVKIPVSELKAGNKVKGTTIAELGNRNRPLDMIAYHKDGHDYILMANSSRGMMKLDAANLDTYKPITAPTEVTGVPYQTLAEFKGVQQLDKFDDASALILTDASGTLDLRTIPLP